MKHCFVFKEYDMKAEKEPLPPQAECYPSREAAKAARAKLPSALYVRTDVFPASSEDEALEMSEKMDFNRF